MFFTLRYLFYWELIYSFDYRRTKRIENIIS